MTLKSKTIHGLKWSFIDSFASTVVQLVIGIILARILTPREFGLIGMLAIFIAISQSFIDSGFSSALTRKKNCTQNDYSTIFYFNLGVGVFLYLLLIIFNKVISSFFNEPQLGPLVIVLGFTLVLNAIAIIQRTILVKEINFKQQARVTFVASVISGFIGLFMALQGYGVWSLVGMTVSKSALISFFLWIWSSWKPSFVFSKDSFKELFPFGSKLLLSGLIDTIYQNIFYLIIGKYYSALDLGYYTRAEQLSAFPSKNLNTIISRVSYPVLASIQDDPIRLKSVYKKQIKSTMFLTFVLMLGLAATSQSLILTLLGEKWLPSVLYLQLLCIIGMLYPLHALNLNMLQVQGRSDLFLKLEIIKKTISIPVVVIGIWGGIIPMLIGMIVFNVFGYFLNSHWSGKLFNYSALEQIKDILPSLLFAITVALSVYFVGGLLDIAVVYKLLIQIVFGVLFGIFIAIVFHMDSYFYMKDIVVSNFKRKRT